MNAAFMGRALNRKSIQLNGHFSPKQSWLELCREFVQYTKALSGPCGGIILTGGMTAAELPGVVAPEELVRGDAPLQILPQAGVLVGGQAEVQLVEGQRPLLAAQVLKAL